MAKIIYMQQTVAYINSKNIPIETGGCDVQWKESYVVLSEPRTE